MQKSIILSIMNYMTATGHALIATLIVAKFQNPYLSLPLAFASHFACDVIPHWDSGTHHHEKTKNRLFIEAGIDVGLSIILSYVLYYYIGGQEYGILLLGIFLSQLPDWLTAPYFILHMKSPLVSWSKQMYHFQHKINSRLDKPWGIVTQIGTIILLYILLFIIF